MSYKIIYYPVGESRESAGGFNTREQAFNWLQNSGIDYDHYRIKREQEAPETDETKSPCKGANQARAELKS